MSKCYIIAEAGVNHNGSLEFALSLIDAAAEAGADAVKFQTFRTEALVTQTATMATYQKQNMQEEMSQFDLLKKLELPYEWQQELKEYALSQSLDFLSTPFDLESLSFLVQQLRCQKIKIGSGDLTNAPLLFHLAQQQCDVILSTGMSSLQDIESALMVLAYGYTQKERPASYQALTEVANDPTVWGKLKEKVWLLHCVSQYPLPYAEVNLRAIQTLAQAFQLPVGYSDHTLGIEIPIAAVAMGASVIEKHLTLDCCLPGPDHRASIEPDEFKQMVTAIRHVEIAMGHGRKVVMPCEKNTRAVARKSIVAKQMIQAGELFTEENVTTKRPYGGVSPFYYWDLIGLTSDKDYHIDQWIQHYECIENESAEP